MDKLAEVDTVTSERKYILWIGPDNVTFKRIQMICFLKTCQNTSLRLLDTTLCDTVLSVSATGRWFSPSTPVSSTNKTDRHDITEILLKVALNTITPFFKVLRAWRSLDMPGSDINEVSFVI